MAEILEVIMLVCFGLSWPINAVRHIRSRTTKGVSLYFLLLIIAGYIAGIAKTLTAHGSPFVLTVYIVNVTMVTFDLAVYFANRRRENRLAAEEILQKTPASY